MNNASHVLVCTAILFGVMSRWGLAEQTYREIVFEDNPAAWWSLDETSDAVAASSTNWLNGTYRYGVASRRGVSGYAASFSGQPASQIEIALGQQQDSQLESIFNTSFSIEMWLLDEAAAPNGTTNYSILYKADRRQFVKNSLWFYRTRQTGDYVFRIEGAQGSVQLTIPNPSGQAAAGDRQWHHVVIAIDRDSDHPVAVGYLDAKEVSRQEIAGTPVFDNDGSFLLGNNHHENSPWRGAIDEVAIYRHALESNAIGSHFTTGTRWLKHRPIPEPNNRVANGEEFFELKIRPLFEDRCVSCHTGDGDAESPLAFHSRQALIKGGDFGPAIIPGRSDGSLIVHVVRHAHKELRMPPDPEDRLTQAEIDDLVRWIDAGAVWGKPAAGLDLHVESSSDRSLSTEHWAFQPRHAMEPPAVSEDRWSWTVIDRFVEAKRPATPSAPPADRRTLIRRATYDLTGLPPTPAEVSAFMSDQSDDTTALAKVIDRLLASDQYGQRQGRLWLDVARYADTQGDVGDFPIPTAYLYRNWVINAFAEDMPFNEFIRAQIAGDLLAIQESDPEEARQKIIATGFVALSRRFGNRKPDDMHLTIEDTIDTIGRGVLGLTLRCSRCHDHKFDPVLNTDYYRLYGIFQSTVYPWMGMSDQKSPSDLAAVTTDPVILETAQDYWGLISRYEYQINNHHRPWLKPTLEEFKKVSSQIDSSSEQEPSSLQKKREELLARHDGKFRELMLHGLPWIRKEKQQLAENPPVEFVFAVSEGTASDARLHRRGNPKQLGSSVPRGFLQVLDPKPAVIAAGSGRLELADWLTQDDHPLTPRVIVNRIWQQHFGTGIVATSDNFGRQGALPSHPELLDWLTEQFVRDRWSIKKLHRRIMLSQTYRMASGNGEDSTWLTQFPRRRLDAEEIRDAMLAVSGELDYAQGQRHPLKPWYAARYSLNSPFHENFPTFQRSVFVLSQRLFRNQLFALFDGPDRNSSTSGRDSSNVPSQALFLMNSPFVRARAEALARRLARSAESDVEPLSRLYQLAFGRPPSDQELTTLATFIQNYQKQSPNHPSMIAVCRAVMTSNEFFYVD